MIHVVSMRICLTDYGPSPISIAAYGCDVDCSRVARVCGPFSFFRSREVSGHAFVSLGATSKAENTPC
jgi:hypothetical protein